MPTSNPSADREREMQARAVEERSRVTCHCCGVRGRSLIDLHAKTATVEGCKCEKSAGAPT